MPRLQEKICLGGIKMTKKLDNTAISTLKTEVEASYSTAETSLYEIFKALSVLTQSANFRGAGAESHKLFLQEASLNYAYVLLEVTQTFKTYISEVEKGFLEYESEVSGKVNTDTVSEYKTSLSGIAKQIELLKSDLTSPESIARSHGVNVVSTGAGNLATQFFAIDSNLEKVNQDLADTDSSLKGKATIVSEAISNLKSNLDSVSSTYITSTGKYNTATIGQLTKQDWYLKGNKDIFADRQKSDPFVYNAGSVSVWEGQYAVGLAKDAYTVIGGSLLSGNYSAGVDGGSHYISANGSLVSAKIENKVTSFYKNTATFNIGSASIDAAAGLSDETLGAYFDSTVVSASLSARQDFFGGLVSTTSEITGPYAELGGGVYTDDDNFYLGVNASASAGELSQRFDLFNFEYKPENSNKKPIRFFGMSADVKESGGGGGKMVVSGEKFYDDVLGWEWLDLGAVTLEAGGKLGIGGDLSVTIPLPWLDFNY